jgi:hypothetical protein
VLIGNRYFVSRIWYHIILESGTVMAPLEVGRLHQA